MFSSIKLGKLFGIDTYLHTTFWLLPLFVLFRSFGGGLEAVAFGLLFIFALFACVALHEVGHALAGAVYGIRTRDITLYPIGGVARLERMPEKPLQEVAVALAGPAVNVVIALGLLVGMAAAGMTPSVYLSPHYTVEAFFSELLLANVALVIFNLLPAFPMDGGRVLRALLSLRMPRLRATEVAVKVGTVLAILMLVAGFALPDLNLILVAVVVWLLGQAELAQMRLMAAGKEFEARAREMFDDAPAPARSLPVDTAADLAARRFSGLAWDADRRVWVQWLNGVPVRDLPA
jgi:Zn-dependent protease